MNDKPGAALALVRAAMAAVFTREYLDGRHTPLFSEDPRAVVKSETGFVFIYAAVVYGIDNDRDVVWENVNVPGVDARRCFDLDGRDVEVDSDRLRTLLEHWLER
jgi:hypothetical protein